MRKKIILLFCVLPAFILQAQRKVINVWRYFNSAMVFQIDSMNSYELFTIWHKEENSLLSDEASENEGENDIIYWSKGEIVHRGDTLLCIDYKTKKKIYFVRQNEDILRVTDWRDYTNRNDGKNWHKGWNNDPEKKVCIEDLFRLNRFFYFFYLSEKNVFTGENKLLELYDWKDGIKKVIYKAGK